jgi:phosphate transport system protein
MTQHEHIVKSFDTELQRLYGEISRMGQLAVRQLELALAAVVTRDDAAADKVVHGDGEIDRVEQEAAFGLASADGARPAGGVRRAEGFR